MILTKTQFLAHKNRQRKPVRTTMKFAAVAFFGLVVSDAVITVAQIPFIRDASCPFPKEAFGRNYWAALNLIINITPEQPRSYGAHAKEIADEQSKAISYDLPAKTAACYFMPSNLLVKTLQHLRGNHPS